MIKFLIEELHSHFIVYYTFTKFQLLLINPIFKYYTFYIIIEDVFLYQEQLINFTFAYFAFIYYVHS